MDQKIGKLITTNEALHPRDDIDRLYVSRKEAKRRGLTRIEDCLEEAIKELKGNIKRAKERQITVDNTIIDITRTIKKNDKN